MTDSLAADQFLFPLQDASQSSEVSPGCQFSKPLGSWELESKNS